MDGWAFVMEGHGGQHVICRHETLGLTYGSSALTWHSKEKERGKSSLLDLLLDMLDVGHESQLMSASHLCVGAHPKIVIASHFLSSFDRFWRLSNILLVRETRR